MNRLKLMIWACMASTLLGLFPARAQQITGVPGAPNATTTIQSDQIPPPPAKFGGKIERNAAQSEPYRTPPRRTAQGRSQRTADHH